MPRSLPLHSSSSTPVRTRAQNSVSALDSTDLIGCRFQHELEEDPVAAVPACPRTSRNLGCAHMNLPESGIKDLLLETVDLIEELQLPLVVPEGLVTDPRTDQLTAVLDALHQLGRTGAPQVIHFNTLAVPKPKHDYRTPDGLRDIIQDATAELFAMDSFAQATYKAAAGAQEWISLRTIHAGPISMSIDPLNRPSLEEVMSMVGKHQGEIGERLLNVRNILKGTLQAFLESSGSPE